MRDWEEQGRVTRRSWTRWSKSGVVSSSSCNYTQHCTSLERLAIESTNS
jgi:hypothetical protein